MRLTSARNRKRLGLLGGIAMKALFALGLGGFAMPAMAITTQDNIDPEALVDVDNVFSNVVGLGIITQTTPAGGRALFVCSGTLVNPRTVFTATHCVANDFGGSEIYTENGRYRIGVTFDPEFGIPGLINWANTNTGMINATDVIMPVGQDQPGVFSFPDQDFTMLALGSAIDIEGAPILLSPISHDFLATMVGFGTTGTGHFFQDPDTGAIFDDQFLDFRRRSAVNLVQYLGNFDDIVEDAGFGAGQGGSTQMLYWVDFDPVDRAGFFDPHPLDWDPLPGEAIVNDDPKLTEGNTGGGDSGGPLFTELAGRNFITGTLSGGLTFFADDAGNGLFGFYGEHTYWNPLYKYAAMIIANNPYKYVSAKSGNGDWTDARHWVQELDPGYYVLDAYGNPVNAAPRFTPDDEDVKFGLGRDLLDIFFNGGDGLPDSANNRGVVDGMAQDAAGALGAGTPVLPGRPGPLQGPGSTNFVPNNTDGIAGVAYSSPAQYFDVTFSRKGETRLRDGAIEVDHVTLAHEDARVRIDRDASLTVNLETEILLGRLRVDGVLATRNLVNAFGSLEGSGRIVGDVLNLGGVVSPGSTDVGTLTIDGDFGQAGFGTFLFQIGKNKADLLEVNGLADVGGNLLVASARKLRFGDRFTVIHADSIAGNFDHTFGSGTLLFGATVADADSVDLVINAQSLASVLGAGSPFKSLALALDSARVTNFTSLTGVFDVIDNAPIADLNGLMASRFAPMQSFDAVRFATSNANGFTQDLALRTSELRAGQRGLSQRSILTGMQIAQAGAAEGAALQQSDMRSPELGDRFGLFVAGQGNLTSLGQEESVDARHDPMQLSQGGSADLTIGADYRVSEHLALGVATTFSRFLQESSNQAPTDQESYGAFAYAAYWDGPWFVDSFAGVMRQDYAGSRLVGFGLADELGANAGSTQTMAGVRAGWTFEPVDGLAVGPTVSLNYSRLNLDAYSEAGIADFALAVDERAITSTTIETGFGFTYQPGQETSQPLSAYGRVGLVTELGDGVDVVHASFVNAREIGFDMTRELDRRWVSAAAGFSYAWSPNTTAYLQAQSDQGRAELSNSSVMLGFNHRF